jgi:hypothetical protein
MSCKSKFALEDLLGVSRSDLRGMSRADLEELCWCYFQFYHPRVKPEGMLFLPKDVTSIWRALPEGQSKLKR